VTSASGGVLAAGRRSAGAAPASNFGDDAAARPGKKKSGPNRGGDSGRSIITGIF
jgi:hypothetical protein